jgi:hypothetical protein
MTVPRRCSRSASPWPASWATHGSFLGDLARLDGDLNRALGLGQEGLAVLDEVGEKLGIAIGLERVGVGMRGPAAAGGDTRAVDRGGRCPADRDQFAARSVRR